MRFDYTLSEAHDRKTRLGLIVLQSDETIEADFARLFPPGGRTHLLVSRVASAPEVTTDTLARMEADLPRAAGLMPAGLHFDAVGYGCTSGTAVIGARRVAELVRAGCTAEHVTEPLSALVAACAHLGVSRLAFLSPYVETVSDRLRAALAGQGVESPVFGSFHEAEEARVVRMAAPSIVAAATELGRDSAAEALFLSCTNLPTFDVIAEIEAITGKPVLSSNLVLGWDLARRAGLELRVAGLGRLLAP